MDLLTKVASSDSILVNYSYLADGTKTSSLKALLHVTYHLGSVRAVIDGCTGEILEASQYSAYGTRSGDTTTYRDHFTGQEDQMPDFGIPYSDHGARQYSPALRRWMTPDPLSEKYYGLSPYNYCGDDPVNAVDLDGCDILMRVPFEGQIAEFRWNGNEFVSDKTYNITDERALKFMNNVASLLKEINSTGVGNDIISFFMESSNHNSIINMTNKGPGVMWFYMTTENGLDRIQICEIYTTFVENLYRAEQRLPLRTDYAFFLDDTRYRVLDGNFRSLYYSKSATYKSIIPNFHVAYDDRYVFYK